MSKQSLDIEVLRERLEGKEGPEYWRSLDEVAGTEAFQELLHREFPEGASEWKDPEGRRRFLKIMSASLVLAGALPGCTLGGRDGEKIVPYVEQPEEVVPGEPLFFATAFPWQGYAQGVLVESHEGRPTKVEGNPDHPASLGATNVFMQASILDLYDPDRSANTRHRGQVSTWTDFAEAMSAARGRLRRDGGAGLRLLTDTVTSPTLADQIRQLLDAFPEARWHRHEPIGDGAVREGLRQTLGREAKALYRFDRAEVVFSIGADFLFERPGSVRYTHDFTDRRRVRADETAMNRLYVAEATPTITGSMADHRLPLPPRRLERLAHAAAARLGVGGAAPEGLSERERAWLEVLASDLEEHGGESLVVAGRTQPPAVHVLAHAMNRQLGSVGETVEYVAPVEARPEGERTSLRALVEDMQAGRVDTLVILGGNPVYTAPADLDFAKALAEVPTSVHLSTHVDETSARCVWHVPKTHYLETWSDARAFDGSVTIMQPLIDPLYNACRSVHEVLEALQSEAGRSSYEIVTDYWRRRHEGPDAFAEFWQRALFDGVVPGTGRLEALPQGAVPGLAGRTPEGEEEMEAPPPDTTAAAPPDTLAADTAEAPAPLPEPPDPVEEEALEIVFRPDPSLWDGRFANNGWLQELPKPLTKLTWDNAALVSPSTAERLELENEEVVELQYRGRSVEAPVWIVPGHADGCVTVYLGHGRDRAGRVGDGAGFNAYRLRTSDALWSDTGLSLEKIGARYVLATTQHHHSMEGRELVVEAPIERFREDPDFVKEGRPMELPTLYPEYEYDSYKWGMVIDENTCIGCNACVVACQAENNIPVVGKEEVRRGREMHWLRVDRYYKGSLDNPETLWQPVPCMHCEKAPCEVVCPVAATVHDEEGLNVMIYNRCVGTRYCSNNCPYKVRRFNFLEYTDFGPEERSRQGGTVADRPDTRRLQYNPDVTVRSRGVMEKCTYCIQRISAARIQAKNEDRRIRDGEVLTACQQACPTGAIVFGDLNDATAEVHRLQEQPHEYALLAELGTQPRTTYLAAFSNPNEALGQEGARRERSQEAGREE